MLCGNGFYSLSNIESNKSKCCPALPMRSSCIYRVRQGESKSPKAPEKMATHIWRRTPPPKPKSIVESFRLVMTHKSAKFVVQLSKTKVQRREAQIFRLLLEPARIAFVYLGGSISGDSERRAAITRRLQRSWSCFQGDRMEIHDCTGVPLRLKVRMLDLEVFHTLLYECTT